MDKKEKFKGRRVDVNVTCTQTATDLVAEAGATQNPNKLEEKPKTQFGEDPLHNTGMEKTLIM